MRLLTVTLYALSLLAVAKSAAVKKPFQMDLYSVKQNRFSLHKRNHLHSMTTPLFNDIESSEVVVKVNIGTPAKEFLLLFDTGGADSWIPSTECEESDGCPDAINRLDSSDSSTFIPLDEEFNITYGNGGAAGAYFMDVVSLANGYTINQQIMGLVTENTGLIAMQSEEDDSDSILIDGVFGAGFPSNTARYRNDSSKSFDPFPMALYNQGFIPQPLFSVYMTGLTDTSPGKVVMGGVDCSKIKGPIKYANLVELTPSLYTDWVINLRGLQIDNGTDIKSNFIFSQLTPFVIDTGSNYMYLPAPLAADLAKAIDPDSYLADNGVNYVVDCKYMNSTVKFNVFLSHTKEEDPATAFISTPVSNLIARRSSDQQCLFLFIGTNNQFIIGNMFLRYFVSIFDFGTQPRIGFGTLA